MELILQQVQEENALAVVETYDNIDAIPRKGEHITAAKMQGRVEQVHWLFGNQTCTAVVRLESSVKRG